MPTRTKTTPERIARPVPQGVSLRRLLTAEWFVMLRAPRIWITLAAGLAFAVYGQWELHRAGERSVADLASCATGATVLVGIIGVMSGARDHETGRAVLVGAVTAAPMRILAAKLLMTIAATLIFAAPVVLALQLERSLLTRSALLPAPGMAEFDWMWGALLVNAALMLCAAGLGAWFRSTMIAEIIWLAASWWVIFFLPNHLAAYSPAVLMKTAPVPFMLPVGTDGTNLWPGPSTWAAVWLVLLAWVVLPWLLAIIRQRLEGTRTPHGVFDAEEA